MIDDPQQGGSHDGAWARAIRDTPGLSVEDYEPVRGGIAPPLATHGSGAPDFPPVAGVPQSFVPGAA